MVSDLGFPLQVWQRSVINLTLQILPSLILTRIPNIPVLYTILSLPPDNVNLLVIDLSCRIQETSSSLSTSLWSCSEQNHQPLLQTKHFPLASKLGIRHSSLLTPECCVCMVKGGPCTWDMTLLNLSCLSVFSDLAIENWKFSVPEISDLSPWVVNNIYYLCIEG